MKKLMIAAAAAAMIGGASAYCVSDADDCGVCAQGGANVWDVKFTAKTTVLKTAGRSSNPCAVGSTAYRKQGTAKITGWLWNDDDCYEDCDLDFGASNTIGNAPRLALVWNKNVGFTVDAFSIFVAQIDKKGNKLEAWGDMSDATAVDIKFAGFGSYDTKKNLIKSISGGFAGTLGNELIGSACAAAVGGVANYDCASYLYDGNSPTAAYGSWSIKYNKSASKKAAKAVAGLGIVQGDDDDDDEGGENLDAAVASIFKFSKYGIDVDDDIVEIEIATEEFAGEADEFEPETED